MSLSGPWWSFWQPAMEAFLFLTTWLFRWRLSPIASVPFLASRSCCSPCQDLLSSVLSPWISSQEIGLLGFGAHKLSWGSQGASEELIPIYLLLLLFFNHHRRIYLLVLKRGMERERKGEREKERNIDHCLLHAPQPGIEAAT